jgi:hypothetical protein
MLSGPSFELYLRLIALFLPCWQRFSLFDLNDLQQLASLRLLLYYTCLFHLACKVDPQFEELFENRFSIADAVALLQSISLDL